MINFDMKHIIELSTWEEAYALLGKHYMLISPEESRQHVRAYHGGEVYGLRQVGTKWVGYKKPAPINPLAVASLDQWDGIWDQAFEADTLAEAVTGFAYLIQAEGCLEEFKNLMERASFVKP